MKNDLNFYKADIKSGPILLILIQPAALDTVCQLVLRPAKVLNIFARVKKRKCSRVQKGTEEEKTNFDILWKHYWIAVLSQTSWIDYVPLSHC